MKPGRGRFEHSRDHPTPAATHARRVGQWQTACLTNRASGVRFPPRRLWPRSEVVETPGRGPGGSRFESGRSPHRDTHAHCEGSGISEVSYALPAGSIPALATNATQHNATPMGRWRNGKRNSLARRRLRVRIPRGPPDSHNDMSADVAQLAEARRSERRQCGFESRRQYSPGRGATGSAPASETGGWEFESLRPDQRKSAKRNTKTMRDGGTGTTPGSEPGAPGSNPGLAATRCLCSCRAP